MVELATLRGARIIGPNCLGIIVPDVIKMGGIGGPAKNAAQAYTPGPIGVISRSGGMTTEMSSTLSAAGLGQSTAVSIGGDAIIGSSYAELMPLFEADEQTQGIVIYTEPGGRMEAELARWVTEQQLAPADRRVHGGPLHGRDARHELRARRHDRRRQGGHRLGEDRAAGPGGHRGGRADRGHPRDDRRARSPSGARRATDAEGDGIFIAVEVDDAAAADTELARKLTEACPVDIFAQRDERRAGDRRAEPRRVRAVPPVPGRRADGPAVRACGKVSSSTTTAPCSPERYRPARCAVRRVRVLNVEGTERA